MRIVLHFFILVRCQLESYLGAGQSLDFKFECPSTANGIQIPSHVVLLDGVDLITHALAVRSGPFNGYSFYLMRHKS